MAIGTLTFLSKMKVFSIIQIVFGQDKNDVMGPFLRDSPLTKEMEPLWDFFFQSYKSTIWFYVCNIRFFYRMAVAIRLAVH